MLAIVAVSRGPVCSEPQYNAGMLDGFISVIKFCTNGSHIFTLCIHQEFFHPVYGNHLRIVVQKKNIFSLCKRNSIIIYPGIIKGFPFFWLISHHTNLRLRFKFFIIVKNFFAGTIIFDNNNLIIFISWFFQNRIHATLQILLMILICNYNRNFRTSNNLITNFKYRFKRTRWTNLEMFKSMSAQMVCHCSFGCLHCIWLCLNSGRHTSFMTSPIIK